MFELKFSNKNVAQLLRNVATSYALIGDPMEKDGKVSRFRIIAYEKAADAIENLSQEIYEIWKSGKLYSVPGIGQGIGSAIEEFFSKGESSHFNQVLNLVPASVFVLMNVSGIGPKKAFRLVQEFKTVNEKSVIEDIKKVAEEGKIASLEGFGEKSQKDIAESIKIYLRKDKLPERIPLATAKKIAEDIALWLKKLPNIKRIDFMGSLRRKVATIGDIDVAVAVETESGDIVEHFIKYPGTRSIEGAGLLKASIIATGNIRVDLRVQKELSYGTMLQYFTGSKAHNIKLREYALKKGFSLSEFGLKNLKGGLKIDPKFEKRVKIFKNNDNENLLTFENEADLYDFLGFSYIPPEIREDKGELELALKNKLPALVELEDIRGDLHMHSSYDVKTSHDLGKSSFEELVLKAKSKNYIYIGFTDHNPRQSNITNEEILGILRTRKEYIDQIIKPMGMPCFIGLEVDIKPNGELALPDSAFEYVDYIIASVHSAFHQDSTQMTKRILRALSYPKVRILGHPTGRLIGKREGINANWEKVFHFIKENNQALEINSSPARLDLPDNLVYEVQKKDLLFIINTDAHEASNMDLMEYGVSVARRGWLPPDKVVNTWSLEKFSEWIIY